MKKKNKQKKEKNKLIITIVTVLVIIAIIGGATFAYWSWETNTAQQTHVTVEVQGAILTIDGTNVTNATMVPTANCAGQYSLIGEATFTAVNGTDTDMSVIPMIDIILTPAEGRTLDDDDKSHLHWTLVDTSTSKTCANADYSGTFNKVAKVTVTKDASGNVSISSPTVSSATTGTTALIANIGSNNEISQLKFLAPAKNATNPTTKTYRLYVWLDSTYTHTNYGDEVSDPMQDLNLTVKWSPSSTMEQVSLITFTIGDQSFSVEKGTTWRQYVDSGTNSELWKNGNNVGYAVYGNILDGEVPVTLDAEIKDGGVYTTER